MYRLIGQFGLAVGVLVLGLTVRAAPPVCTDNCTETSSVFDCTNSESWVFEKTVCSACRGDEKGWTNCQEPANGGSCKSAEEQITINVYASGVEVCPNACQNKNGAGKSPALVQGIPTVTKVKTTFKDDRQICK
jgi:hypothetical protein